MSSNNIDDRKPNIHDFPPTRETKKLRMWDITNLCIDKDSIPKHMALRVDFDKGERFYENRVYPCPDRSEIKILSKININTNKINMIVKTENGVLIPPRNRSYTEAEYRKEVQQMESFLSKRIDISKVSVSDGKAENEFAESIVKKYQKGNAKI